MKIIRKDEAVFGTNNDNCKTIEYSFGDKDIDIGVATITGRYPESGFCANLVSKELVYIIEGSGELCFEDETITFSEGDAILIEKNKKYYWKADYCKVSMSCSPAWSPEQYKVVQ